MTDENQTVVPSTLRDLPNWIVWREEQREDDDEPTKVPYTAFGRRGEYASTTDADTWTDYESACEYHQEYSDYFDGVGFVFDGDGVLLGIDLDDCRDAETGDVDPWAQDVIDRASSFTEVSPSGEGFHIYAVGIKPGDNAKGQVDADGTIHDEPEFEMYDESRYFTFTGQHVDGTPETVEKANGDVKELYEEYLADDEPEPEPEQPDAEPVEVGDDKLIEKIKNSGQGDKFERLWRGDTSGYQNDHSRADLALCGILAFWTGGDRTRMDQLFRRSGLMRSKWDEDRGSQTYGERTIDKALEGQTEFYEPNGNGDDPTPKPDRDTPSDVSDLWKRVRQTYRDDTNKEARVAAARALEAETDWMYVLESEILWVYDADRGYFNEWGEQRIHRILESELGSNYSQREVNEIVARVEARNQTHRHELNARTRESPLLCVGNGVVNLETGNLREHDPDLYFTRGLKWDYTPEDADPDTVLKFLDSVTKREADRDTILDHLAHGLMPGHPFRAFIIMYGPGSNGKTRVGKLLRGFVGEDNAASVELQAFTGDDAFATGGLPGAFVNVGDDISVGEVRDTSIIKTLTGDGTLRANEKNKKQYEFENEAAMFFSANEPPRFRERTDAIADRLYPIKMPYRFVDHPDPDNQYEKRKIPGIARSMVNDDAAMRGLLALAVEHAQSVIERNGEYSMPESPRERREMYEAASDPIKRFALELLKPGDDGDLIRKKDAFDVYTEMCERHGKRATNEDTFKQVVGEMASLDITSARSRRVTAGDSRDRCWRYVQFTDDAYQYMNSRLAQRYADESADTSDDTDDYSARTLATVAGDPTGYATVTVEAVSVDTPDGENSPAMKAVVKDESTAMDLVSWDHDRLFEEGDCVLIENAAVGEYKGNRQLRIEPGVTEISSIQKGAVYTEHATPDDGQESLTATDGGDEIVSVRQRVMQELNGPAYEPGDKIRAPSLSGEIGGNPEHVKAALEQIARETSLIAATEDGEWEKL